jgi:lysophospholipase L1-like esterase
MSGGSGGEAGAPRPPWRQVPTVAAAGPGPFSPGRGVALRGLVLAVVAAVAAVQGAWVAAAVAVGAGVVLTVVALASSRAAALIDGVARRVGDGGAAVVATVGVGLVELLVGLPGRLVSRLRRRNPLTGGPRRPTTTWRSRAAPGLHVERPDRPWAGDVPGRAPRPPRPFPRPLGILAKVAVVVVVDLVAGTFVPRPQVAPWLQPVQEVRGRAEPGVPEVPDRPAAERARVSAFGGAPWAAGCLREVAGLGYDHVPFLVRAIRDAPGPCVAVRDGERAGYRPRGDDLPEVWLLGSSAAFGEGQRDSHTIASELARQAEAAGRPVRVRNLAVPGSTTYQDALRLEQLLAVRGRPDLVVLYGGVNDLAAQLVSPTDQATWLPATLWRSDHPAGTRSLWDRWHDASLGVRAWTWLTGEAAGAEPGGASGPSAADEAPAAEVAEATVRAYGRAVALARRVAASYDVPIEVVFQATRFARRHPVARRVLARLPRGVVDLSSVFGAQASALFVDGVHTNEAGARVVATRLRAELRGTVLHPAGP